MRRSRQLSLKDCYQLLSLAKDATLEDVKRAYRRRAFELHPDLNPGRPDAALQFQRLNEAYVALSQVLQAKEKAQGKNAETSSGARSDAEGASASGAASQKRPQAEESHGESEKTSFSDAQFTTHTAEHASSENDTEEARNDAADAEARKRANAAYGKEDVLRDLLNDPFARRVFEDIYSEVNKQDSAATPPAGAAPPPPPPKPRKVSLEWGRSKLSLDFSHGIKGVVKGWLRSQIDEIQTFRLPASSLVPRARIRLQIRRGLSDDLVTVEITLPPDFVVGKPVRLKGLGKRVGPWQGDLYLTLEPK